MEPKKLVLAFRERMLCLFMFVIATWTFVTYRLEFFHIATFLFPLPSLEKNIGIVQKFIKESSYLCTWTWLHYKDKSCISRKKSWTRLERPHLFMCIYERPMFRNVFLSFKISDRFWILRLILRFVRSFMMFKMKIPIFHVGFLLFR